MTRRLPRTAAAAAHRRRSAHRCRRYWRWYRPEGAARRNGDRPASRSTPSAGRDIRRDSGPCRYSVGARHPRAVALYGQSRRRFGGLDGVIDEIRQLILDTLRPVFFDARHDCWRAYSRSQLFSRSRCLIDLTIDGLALSKSTAGIQWRTKSRQHRPRWEIIHENAGMQQNTLNGGFPRFGHKRPSRNSTKDVRGAGLLALRSYPAFRLA